MKKMRRIDRLMTEAETLMLLEKGEYGILSSADSEGQACGTPVNYVFSGKNIYVHSALTGAKLDNIKANPKVCFTVVGATKVLPSEFATEYESVMAFGKASIASEEEKEFALSEIVRKYSPGFMLEGDAYILANLSNSLVIKIAVEELSGKHRL
jgi:hypothetical protein